MKTILIIEDDKVFRQSLVIILESEGYKVISASGGLEAIKFLEELKPDLIITDIIMDDTDGFDIIIHAKKQLPETRIIAMTGVSIIRPDRYLETA